MILAIFIGLEIYLYHLENMLANFTNIKKYSLENPAWFNDEAIKLRNQRKQENVDSLYLQNYLWSSNGNLDELKL